ncbi:Exonuclease SbcC [Agreia sp. COWG]|nr:Exonuclease SbcC [Agreia sp. COWG]
MAGGDSVAGQGAAHRGVPDQWGAAMSGWLPAEGGGRGRLPGPRRAARARNAGVRRRRCDRQRSSGGSGSSFHPAGTTLHRGDRRTRRRRAARDQPLNWGRLLRCECLHMC